MEIVGAQNGVEFLVFKNISQTGIARHCVSTRKGGVSEGPFASMNLGYATGDSRANVDENYRRLCAAVGLDPEKIVRSRQRHGLNVRAIDGADENVEDDVDGLMTDKPGVVLATFYADCVPLLFCDPARRVVATSHSGWKGCAGNMAARTVARMGERYGCDPADILAGIGPCISRANYEVGSEVAERFAGEFASCFFSLAEKPGKYLLDLREACRLGLLSAGLRGRNIDVAPEGMCAFACREMFFSHRRDGSPRGSLAALIALDL